MSSERQRVLAIGLDAGDAPLLLGWMAEGRLPALADLAGRGSVVRLRTLGDLFPESIWPTVTTGRSLGSHGIYNWRVVPEGGHGLEWVADAGGTPLWQVLSEHGDERGAVLVDIPYVVPLGDDAITELVGWGQRGAAIEASWPPGLLAEVRHRHGRYPSWTHAHYHRRGPAQRRLLRTLLRMTAVRTDLLEELIARRPWTLCMACYPESHDAAHEFHRYLDPEGWGHRRRRARGVEDGLLRTYAALDRAVGRLARAAGEDVNVLVFSLMGMRMNTNGEKILRRLLIGLGHQVPGRGSGGTRPLDRLRDVTPWSIRHLLHLRLGQPTREAIMERMWLERTDWARTRAYAEEEPGVGLVHLNVRGRDAGGLVAPGAEYRALCRELREEIESLRDAASGAPVVDQVLRRDEVVAGPAAGRIPDLIVRFTHERLVDAVRHPRLGILREHVPDVPYSEHSGEGFLVASGPGIRAGRKLTADAEALAPTMLALMGVPAPASMDGEPVADLLEQLPPRAAAYSEPGRPDPS